MVIHMYVILEVRGHHVIRESVNIIISVEYASDLLLPVRPFQEIVVQHTHVNMLTISTDLHTEVFVYNMASFS